MSWTIGSGISRVDRTDWTGSSAFKWLLLAQAVTYIDEPEQSIAEHQPSPCKKNTFDTQTGTTYSLALCQAYSYIIYCIYSWILLIQLNSSDIFVRAVSWCWWSSFAFLLAWLPLRHLLKLLESKTRNHLEAWHSHHSVGIAHICTLLTMHSRGVFLSEVQ